MFITDKDLKKTKVLYSCGVYSVLINPIKDSYSKINIDKEEHLANYIVVNMNTQAVEYAVDQLPHAFEVASGLNNAVAKLTTPTDEGVRLQ